MNGHQSAAYWRQASDRLVTRLESDVAAFAWQRGKSLFAEEAISYALEGANVEMEPKARVGRPLPSLVAVTDAAPTSDRRPAYDASAVK